MGLLLISLYRIINRFNNIFNKAFRCRNVLINSLQLCFLNSFFFLFTRRTFLPFNDQSFIAIIGFLVALQWQRITQNKTTCVYGLCNKRVFDG